MENKNCPYCQSEKTEQVIIRFANGQEQRVGLCLTCRKIFRKEAE